ncbi:hypothetical protein [Lederbergia ruris]|uniref:hypothetical protein n=1 Tax=Lederbergia ruris TaxID=217495 RepID=UPI00399F348F
MRNVIELNKYFKEVEVTEEPWTDTDGGTYIDRFKEVKLGEALTLFLYDSGQATLELENDEGNMMHTFYWDDEAAEMFGNFSEVKAVELFGMIYRKRWRGLALEQ